MPSVAMNVGANRILAGVAITHPLGNPELPPGDEFNLRLSLVQEALRSLCAGVAGQQVFRLAQ